MGTNEDQRCSMGQKLKKKKKIEIGQLNDRYITTLSPKVFFIESPETVFKAWIESWAQKKRKGNTLGQIL